MSKKQRILGYIIRWTAALLRGFSFVLQKLGWAGKPIIIVGRTLGSLLLWLLIIPTYKIYLSLKKIITKFYAPHIARNQLIHPLSRRYLIHFVIIGCSFVTLVANLNAYETRQENFGRTSIAASLISGENLGELEEEGPIIQANRITRYRGVTGVENKPQNTATETLPTTVSGGSALVRPIISPTEQGLRQRDEVVTYVVQPGDTISTIAERFGISSNTILWENDLTAYSVIRPGQALSILPTTGIRHTVSRGDTIAEIAETYDVQPEDIIAANKLSSADDIKINEKLFIPNGKKIVPRQTFAIRTDWYQPPTTPSAPTPKPSTPTGSATATGDMIWPSSCHTITQYYGWRHSGIDIACGFGKNIVAADGGTIATAQGGWNGGYGTYIIIDHGNGLQTLYGHTSQLLVSVGDKVSKGQVIAYEGSTGRSTGPHLHFEVRSGGVRTNPLSYVK